MALPRKKIDITQSKIGKERIEEFMALTNEKSSFLPQGVDLIGLDESFIEFVRDTHLKVQSEGRDIPVFFLTKEKWAEFEMSWQYTDEDGNIVMPFITIKRSEAPKQGTNENIKLRISQNKKFDYLKIPKIENGVYFIDTFKIPQPTPVDLKYEVRIFTHYMEDLNIFNQKIQKTFAGGLAYTNVRGYYMPIKMGDISDESTMNDFDGQKFYCQVFNLTLQGFLLDPDDFEEVKGLRRIIINENIETSKK